MPSEMIEVASKDGPRFGAYLSRPESGTGPGVVMVQEMLGVTPWLKGIADRFAANGYVVLCPDIFWRMHPGFIADHGVEEEYQQAWTYLRALDYDKAVEDVDACAAALRAMPDCNGKVAVTGFCMGGTVAYLAACRLGIDAAAAYYGTGIHKHLDEGKHIACPLTLHLADKDWTYEPEDAKAIHAYLIGIPHVSIWTYDAGHAFANSALPKLYSEAHAEKAHERTLALFDRLK